LKGDLPDGRGAADHTRGAEELALEAEDDAEEVTSLEAATSATDVAVAVAVVLGAAEPPAGAVASASSGPRAAAASLDLDEDIAQKATIPRATTPTTEMATHWKVLPLEVRRISAELGARGLRPLPGPART
jgi:hypothetical protein